MNTSPPRTNSAPSQMTSILAPDWYGLPPTKVGDRHLLRARRGLAPENARVGNVFGIGEAAQVLGPLLAGRVALPAPPLGRERGFGFWLGPRGQGLHRQPAENPGGRGGVL